MEFSQGDIIYVDLNPTKGHEQQGSRPCLIVSNDIVYDNANIIWVVPISSTDREYPLYFPINELKGKYKTSGKIMLDQIRAIDPKKRNAKKTESLNQKDLASVLKIIKLVFDENT